MRSVEKLLVLFLFVTGVAIAACSDKDAKSLGEAKPAAVSTAPAGAVTTPSGLSYVDLVVGNGPQPTSGKPVKVHYTGWLENGTKFDSSVDRGEPFVFTIGAGEVIPGWDEGVMTMKVGGKRRLIVPAQLGYGAAGAGGVIPPNATLIFEVELLEAAK
ncbi:Peptidylprolyl isomerase [Geobacter metallireducens RCH3]|uniref:Peptidyl-prolyl cis-trans isomerase n=1 Tax=Geobacter metallireducens (strain ATCC 53774 / DSM 7210 / GS-15) TaxID=269799 RepID=Q39T37_GEOMG|nr:FKBP-type peptidyl-prolyl cis-trans isomerase [Geobacter metallireducens]ABB32587.1 peptidylprolyl cis-trans isomerase lipoprotein, FKBP-type [Geobacter metallireducens GS-15]EHP86386.1 Peptidylprolyl isomerase [Geobacter metallireducens RCH3]